MHSAKPTFAALLPACALAALTLLIAPAAHAQQLIQNGGFETNGGANTSTLTNWTVVNQANGSGSWYVQTGTGSPGPTSNQNTSVAAPPQGAFAAMTNQAGPGAHVLYQNFVVPVGLTTATLSFDRYIQNSVSFVTANTLDFTGSANQQARVDIMTSAAGNFSVAAGDVLLNVFQTNPGDPPTSGYTFQSSDLTTLLKAHQGETLRLRFAETDNSGFIQFGVDAVSLNTTVPEPSAVAFLVTSVLTGAAFLQRRRQARPVA